MKKKRELDGYYFRVKRNDKFETLCFSDMDDDEMSRVVSDMNKNQLSALAKGLANRMYQIAELYNIKFV